MKITVFSSLPADSGCFLRAKYLASSLTSAGNKATLVPEPRGISFLLHMAYSLFRNLYILFTSSPDAGICIKPYPNTLWPLLIKRFFKKSFLVITDIDDLDYGYRKGILPFLSKHLQLPFPRFCDLVTYHNDNLFHHIQKNFKVSANKMYRLDQGVDFSVYGNINRKKAAELRSKIIRNSKIQKPVLLSYSAHLNVASDLEEILQALKIILHKRDDILLVIAGGGPLLSYFQTKATQLGLSSHTYFTGYLHPNEVALHLGASDFGIVYYRNNHVNQFRTSMKIREYLALGMNVICNNVGDLKEFKDLTFQSGSGYKNLALKILKTLSLRNPGINKKAISYIRRKYDWTLIGKSFSNTLKKIKHS